MVLKNGVINIQAAAYNGACTVNLLSKSLHSVSCASLCSKSEVMLVELVCYAMLVGFTLLVAKYEIVACKVSRLKRKSE